METQPTNWKKKIPVLILLAVALTISLGIYLYQSNLTKVTIILDNEEKSFTSNANTLEELLLKENITLEEGAYISHPLDVTLVDNMTIVIKNPKVYTISVDKVLVDVKSTHDTVKSILADNSIQLGEKDFTNPSLEEKVSLGSTIEVYRVEEVFETYDEVIPFEKVVNKNPKLDIGTTRTIQKGKDGLRKVTVKKEIVNGQVASTIIVGQEVITEPINEIMERGTKDILVTSRGSVRYKKAIVMTATAYDLSYESCKKLPGDKYYGITASGTKARPGVVAVDPKVIPLGTRLYIQSLDGSKDYGFAVAEDTGGAIKGNRIDLFFENSQDVAKFGKRKVKVYILE